jgi:hypothetical protein
MRWSLWRSPCSSSILGIPLAGNAKTAAVKLDDFEQTVGQALRRPSATAAICF